MGGCVGRGIFSGTERSGQTSDCFAAVHGDRANADHINCVYYTYGNLQLDRKGYWQQDYQMDAVR